jgi:hypothetical protein
MPDDLSFLPQGSAFAELRDAIDALHELEAKFATLERLVESMVLAVPADHLPDDEREALAWITAIGTWR